MNIRCTAISILLIASTLSVAVQAQGYVEILPPEITAPYSARRDSIASTLKNVQAVEWAGSYSIEVGETWSEGFIWAPEVGFAAYRDTCSNGPRAWINHGQVTFDDQKLYLAPDRSDDEEFLLKLPGNEFTFIRWGDQRWLVPTKDLALFAYAVNSRSGIEHEIGYLKSSDIQKKHEGLPDLPQDYKKLFKVPPINAKVTTFETLTNKWFPTMTIDAGRNKQVIEGMSLWLTGHKEVQVRVVVTEVNERSAKVEARMVSQTADFQKEVVPNITWRFSSRDPNRQR